MADQQARALTVYLNGDSVAEAPWWGHSRPDDGTWRGVVGVLSKGTKAAMKFGNSIHVA
jgi:hypothetical protein